MLRMAGSQCGQAIPMKLSVEQFEQFVLPHLSTGRRGPAPTLGLHKIFNYILQLLYMGCQWKALPIEKNDEGRPEIHYTRIYRALRRWQADGCIDKIFFRLGAPSFIRTSSSTSQSFTVTARPLPRRRAATTWGTADTST